MKITRSAVAVIAVGGLAAVAGSTLATASVPQANGVINGCYSPTTGALRVTGNGTCKAGEAKVDWNVKGPTGPRGFQGIQGPAGPSAVASTSLVLSTGVFVPANGGANVVVTCPVGKVVLGSGLENRTASNATNTQLAIARSAITSDRTTVNYYVFNNSTTLATTVTAQAICG